MRALVHFQNGESWVCEIRDFCAGGMLLLGDSANLRRAFQGESEADAEVQRGTQIEVLFAVESEQRRNFHMSAEVARVVKGGVGIMFPTPLDQECLDALSRTAGGDTSHVIGDASASNKRTLTGGQQEKISAAVAKLTQIVLLKLIDAFLEAYAKELVDCQNLASDAGERKPFADALGKLRSSSKKVRGHFVAWVVDHIRKRMKAKPVPVPETDTTPRAPEARGLFANTTLTLVEKDDFEQWLVVAEVIHTIEGHVSDDLFVMCTWMGMIEEAWEGKDVNPVCPAMITRSLERVLAPLQLEEEPAKVAFQTFASLCQKYFRAYYDKLYEVLTKTNLFPPIEEVIAEQVKNRNAYSQEREVSSAVDNSTSNRSPAGVARMLGSGGSEQSEDDLRYDVQGQVANVDAQAVVTALANIQAASPVLRGEEAGTTADLRSALLEQLQQSSGVSARLPKRIHNALEMVDYLVSSVDEDEVLSGDVRQWVRQIEITLGKEATLNDDFLDPNAESPHAAFQMLDQLERVDPDDSRDLDAQTHERVDQVLKKLVADWDGSPEAFVQAVEALGPVVERQKKLYSRNLQRVVNGCDGRARLKRAKQTVLSRLASVLENQSLPEVVLDVVQPAWRNLMVNTVLREGSTSVRFQQQLKVIERLVSKLVGGPERAAVPEEKATAILNSLEDGLKTIAYNSSPGLLKSIQRELVTPQAENRSEQLTIAVGDLAQYLDWVDLINVNDPVPPTDDGEARSRWLDTLRRVRVLKTGTRVNFRTEDVERTLILAWAAPGGDAFVFVNRRGMWDRELSLGQLTEELVAGRARILEGYDAPLLERVSERMARRVHDRITSDAQKDELTGLSDRRSFERNLKKAVLHARETGSRHCALQLNLDRFQIVNSAVGYGGGDALLKHIAETLRRSILEATGEDQPALSRIGADEFGLVLHGAEASVGQQVADALVAAVAAQSFTWEEQSLPVSATVGLMEIDQTGEDANHLLQHLSSACRAGKQQGGSCVYRFEHDDAAMQAQEQTMQLASQVENLLADQAVRLNCQKIAAAVDDHPLRGHYEVLITVLDEDGTPRPPIDFIEAAERYGKMPHVDRYVVQNTLEWMSRNADLVEHFGGFSINLSGQSIQQDDFLDFVLHQFERTGAPTSKVCFEVTETAAMGNLTRAAEFIQKIKVTGCQFSLDDFGTGMSSYAYLRELPVDYLKIDGTFVKNLVEDASDKAVVKSINEIGHFMGKKTVAEYVHNEATQAALVEMGVDYLQGWEIEKPKPIDQLREDESILAVMREAQAGEQPSQIA